MIKELNEMGMNDGLQAITACLKSNIERAGYETTWEDAGRTILNMTPEERNEVMQRYWENAEKEM